MRAPLEAGLQELQSVDEALRRRLAAERLRSASRAALLQKAANTSVDSAIKAVHGQDLIVRRRLEVAEKELRRLQEEPAYSKPSSEPSTGRPRSERPHPPRLLRAATKGAALSEPDRSLYSGPVPAARWTANSQRGWTPRGLRRVLRW